MANIAPIRQGVDYSNRSDARRVLIRPEDKTLLTMQSSVGLYFDSAAPNLNPASKKGRSIANAANGEFAWASANVQRVNDGAWGRNVLQYTGTDGDLRFQAGYVPAKFTVILAVSLDAATVGIANGQRYLFSIYSAAQNKIAANLAVFDAGGLGRGLTWVPQAASGNGLNAPATAIPAADARTLIAVRHDGPALTSQIYVNNAAVPVAARTNHSLGAPSGGDYQWCLGNVFGNPTVGAAGKYAKMIVLDDTVYPTTDAQRIAIFADLKAALGTT